ncbi:MAG: LamG-like jellyroll fold domain-containing protein, partial [Planctomycetota bacterium]
MKKFAQELKICIGVFCIVITTSLFSQETVPGTALDFDGVNDYVMIAPGLADSISGDTAITIEYWFTGTQLQSPVRIQQGGYIYIVAGWGASNPTHIISNDGGTTNGISAGNESIIEDGSWHHLAMTWKKNTINGFKSYLDGNLVAQRTSTNVNLPTYSNTISYLGCYDGTSEFLQGKLDEVRVWNVARTVQEIRENMHLTLSGSETGLVSYWQFNEATGDSAFDPVGANHGRLYNMDGSDWITSTVPVGGGSSYTQEVNTTGTYDFTVSGVSVDVTAKSGIDTFVVSRLDLAPIVLPTYPLNELFDSQYWIINKFGSGSFTADLNFNVNEDITQKYYFYPDSIKLFERSGNSEGAWIHLMDATAVSVPYDSATFSDLTAFSQFIIGAAGTPLYITNLSPADDSTEVSPDANLVITFDRPVFAGNGYVTIYFSSDDTPFETFAASALTINDSIVTIDPSSNLYFGTGYYVLVDDTAFHDGAYNYLPAITDPSFWNFETIENFTDISAGLTAVYGSSVAWGDYDNDGDMDILLTGRDRTLTPISRIYRNDPSTGSGRDFNDISAGLTGVRYSSVAWGDYDNDGDLDILLTGIASSGGPISRIYRNSCLTANTAAIAPTGLNAVSNNDSTVFNWNQATDNETPQDGLSYNLFIQDTMSGVYFKTPMADTSSGYRRITTIGNVNQETSWNFTPQFNAPQLKYTCNWGVQAIDHGFAGSPFAMDSVDIISGYLQVLNYNGMGPQDLLSWEIVEPDSILYYQLQIDNDSVFLSPEVHDTLYLPGTTLAKTTSDLYFSVALGDLDGSDNLVDNTRYYWRIKPDYTFPVPTVYTDPAPSFLYILSGAVSDTLHITLEEGWNNIGGSHFEVALNDVIDPDSIIVPGTLYRYEDFYVAADTIKPGTGYWIMASDSGQITMIRGYTSPGEMADEPINLEPFTSLQICDASGQKRELYINFAEMEMEELQNTDIMKSYNLPPLTNQNMFDARFSDDSRLCAGCETIIKVQSSQYPLNISVSNVPQTVQYKYVLKEISGEDIINT